MAKGFIAVSEDQINIGVFLMQAGHAEFRLEAFRIDEQNWDTWEEALEAAEDYASELANRLGMIAVSNLSGKVLGISR